MRTILFKWNTRLLSPVDSILTCNEVTAAGTDELSMRGHSLDENRKCDEEPNAESHVDCLMKAWVEIVR